MQPMLDDLELPQVQEILTHDRRMLAEHKPPGMEGSLLQNMGRQPTAVVLWGIAAGPEALQFVADLDEKFRAAAPLPFIADIVADAEIEAVIIQDVRWQELAGKPDRFAYVLKLNAYIEPTEPQQALFDPGGLLDGGILNDAFNRMESLVQALDLIPEFITGLERYVEPLTTMLARLERINKNLEKSR